MRLIKPRLLPVTIVGISVVLLLKTVLLVQALAGEADPKDPQTAPSGVAAGSAQPAAAPDSPAPPHAPEKSAANRLPPDPFPPTPSPPTSSPPISSPPISSPPAPAAAGAAPLPAATGAQPDLAADANPSGGPAVSEAERSVLLDLRKRRQELDAREKALDERAAEIKAADHGLAERVDQMSALQARLEQMEAGREKQKEENWRGLVKVYEQMKPRDAAGIFNALDMQVLLQVMDRMQERKLAPVLAAMQPDRARLATQLLAEMRTHEITPPGAAGPAQANPKS